MLRIKKSPNEHAYFESATLSIMLKELFLSLLLI